MIIESKFKLGDRVTSEYYGNGIVRCVDTILKYNVIVQFGEVPLGEVRVVHYTEDGLFHSRESTSSKNITL